MDAQQQPQPVLLAEVKVDGYTIRVQQITDPDGDHAIELVGVDCALEGELPGLYYPRPLAIPADDALCGCGHTAHWHSHRGAGDCEHDLSCRCKRFHPQPDGQSAVRLAPIRPTQHRLKRP